MNLISLLETDLVSLYALSTGGLYENRNTQLGSLSFFMITAL